MTTRTLMMGLLLSVLALVVVVPACGGSLEAEEAALEAADEGAAETSADTDESAEAQEKEGVSTRESALVRECVVVQSPIGCAYLCNCTLNPFTGGFNCGNANCYNSCMAN